MENHFGEINILGKDYKFIKPKAVDIIRLEDSCFENTGIFDEAKYYDGMLKLVSKGLSLKNFEEEVNPEIELGDKILTINDVSLKKKIEIDNHYMVGGRIDRITYVEKVLENCVENYRVSDLNYNEINGLIEKFKNKYNDSALLEVIEEISTFL